MNDSATPTMRSALKYSSAGTALAAGLLASGTAFAQQVVPGTSPECPISVVDGENVAVCEGDLEDGVTAFPGTPDFDRIVIRNPDAAIAPPGYFGVGLVKDNGDLDALIEEGVTINVFDDPNIAGAAQGIIAITQNGNNLRLETAANITADGNGSFALGIEAVAQGGGRVDLINQNGDIEAITSGESAIALQGRGVSVAINNSGGILSARSNGTGERSTTTAGILAFANGGNFSILNGGPISVETGADSFDTDFNGIAAAIVGNAFATNQGSSIVNTADLGAVGDQTHGIVGFVEGLDPNSTAQLSIVSGNSPDDTTISTNGIGTYGILAQGRGTTVGLSVLSNSAIDIASGAEGYGIFALQEAAAGEMSIDNQGTINGEGDFLSGILVSTLAGASDGDYTLDITNSGNITLDGDAVTGIGVATEAEDDITATITNSGNIDLTASTNPLSAGIAFAAGTLDANVTGDGDSSVTISNSGRIDMGAGNAIFAAADNVTLIESSGQLSTFGDQSDVVKLGPSGRPAQITATINSILGSTGDQSSGIVIEPLADLSNVFLVLDTSVITTNGSESHAIAVEQLGAASSAEFVINDSILTTLAASSDAVRIDALGEGSALTFNARATSLIAQGTNSRAVFIGGIAGDTSIIAVSLANAELFTQGDTSSVFEVGSFIQNDSVSNLTVVESDFSSLGDDSSAFVVGSTVTSPVDGWVQSIALSDSTFTTQGDGSTGIFIDSKIDGTSDVIFSLQFGDVEIETSGEDANGVEIIGGAGDYQDVDVDIGISGSRITTAGDGSIGFVLGNFGPTFVNMPGPDRDNTFAFTFDTTQVTTSGADAHAVSLGNWLPDSPFEFSDIALTTSGDSSSGILVDPGMTDSISAIVIDASDPMARSTISTSGDGSHGIHFITASKSAYRARLTDTQIVTEGDSSGGFILEGIDTGSEGLSVASAEFQSVEISTVGDNSDAFYVGTLLDDSVIGVTIIDGDFITTGDNSRGIVTQALGDTSVQTVAIDSGRYETSGDNSSAILLNALPESVPDLDPFDSIVFIAVGDATISTLGDASRGVDVASLAGDTSTSVVTLSENQVSTAGAISDAVSIGTQRGTGSIGSSHTISVDLLEVTTTGDDSRGLFLDTFGDGLIAFQSLRNGVVGGDATIFTGDNVIVTSGARSHGIEYATVAGDLEGAIIEIAEAGSTIQTSGENAIGIQFGGVEGAFIDSTVRGGGSQFSLTMTPLSIETSGSGSHGVQIGDLPTFNAADNADVTLTVEARTIATTGAGAHGVVIGEGWGEAGSSDVTGRTGANRYATVIVDGALSVSGAGSDGIISSSLINDFQITEDGSITAIDGFALNFAGVDAGQTALNLGTIDGDVIFGDGDDTLDSSGTITGNIDMGAGANAIFIRDGGLLNSLDTILLGMGNAITVTGDLSPGGVGPFQTTAIGSDLVLGDGSRLLIDIDGMAADPSATGFFVSDRITVDGDISIGDATLAVSSLTAEGDFDRSAQFLILEAAGTLSGEFSAIDADLPFLDLSVTYDAGRAILNAGRDGPVVPFASLGLTPNQRAVGASFDALEMDATGDLDDVIEQLIFASTPQALAAFDSASGEIYASLLAQSGSDGLRHSRAVLSRARSNSTQGWGIWGGVGFSDSSIAADGNGAEVNQDDVGFDIGVDYVGDGNRWAAGIATGWRDGDLEVAARDSSADYDAWYLTGHARYGSGGEGPSVSANIYFGATDAEVTRTLNVNAITRTALGQADIETFAVAAEARYGFGLGDGWAIGPVASLMVADSDLSLDDETGAGSVSLVSADASDSQTRLGAGLFANLQSSAVTFDLQAQYVDGAANSVGARLAFAEGTSAPFTVLAPEADPSGLLAGTSLNVDLGSGWTMGAQLEAMFGSDLDEVNGSLVVGLRF